MVFSPGTPKCFTCALRLAIAQSCIVCEIRVPHDDHDRKFHDMITITTSPFGVERLVATEPQGSLAFASNISNIRIGEFMPFHIKATWLKPQVFESAEL